MRFKLYKAMKYNFKVIRPNLVKELFGMMGRWTRVVERMLYGELAIRWRFGTKSALGYTSFGIKCFAYKRVNGRLLHCFVCVLYSFLDLLVFTETFWIKYSFAINEKWGLHEVTLFQELHICNIELFPVVNGFVGGGGVSKL